MQGASRRPREGSRCQDGSPADCAQSDGCVAALRACHTKQLRVGNQSGHGHAPFGSAVDA